MKHISDVVSDYHRLEREAAAIALARGLLRCELAGEIPKLRRKAGYGSAPREFRSCWRSFEEGQPDIVVVEVLAQMDLRALQLEDFVYACSTVGTAAATDILSALKSIAPPRTRNGKQGRALSFPAVSGNSRS